jgi:hypothetical protein
MAALSVGTLLSVLGWGSLAGAAPSSASYTAKANAVCKTYNAQLSHLMASLAGMTSITKAEQQLEVVISTTLADTKALEAIPRPKSEAAALKKLFKKADTGIVDLRKAVRSLQQGKTTGVDADLSADKATIKPVQNGFKRLGLTTCAATPSAAG